MDKLNSFLEKSLEMGRPTFFRVFVAKSLEIDTYFWKKIPRNEMGTYFPKNYL